MPYLLAMTFSYFPDSILGSQSYATVLSLTFQHDYLYNPKVSVFQNLPIHLLLRQVAHHVEQLGHSGHLPTYLMGIQSYCPDKSFILTLI